MKKIIAIIACLYISMCFADQSPNQFKPSDNPYTVHAVVFSENSAVISSPMAGLVTNLLIKDGSTFKKGQILIRFDCRIQHALLQKISADIKLSLINKESYAKLSKLGSASNMKVAESHANFEKGKKQR